MYVISSKGIPADVNGGDDVATRKYKSTCGKGGGSFCCSVSALCVYVLFTVVCPIYIENISWQLARNKSLTRSVSDCVPLPARSFITGGDTQSVRCLYGSGARLIVFACLCEHSTPGERSLRRALSPVLLAFPVPLSLRQSGA